MYWFVIEVKILKPYGLKVDYDPNLQNQMKVYHFWSKYVHVFLKMKRLGETVSLQKAINHLVKTKFEETSLLMKLFLVKTDGHSFPPNRPVLYQFLKFFSLNNKSKNENEYALRALLGFENEHVSSDTL
ncbi:uncharacterized protein MELLADRAFT_105317 [Melampsora larici-populina 98AG31]|uniref:Uncharacterized protein n=1 Tax=Melampsora larici-populina (strain 98AG31 / pathotype 3-4-7) TaxID=747676 RepID=F4RHQ6_MELLP|nr:uncharacterized protein MELLADRAFT_105317 [Melampsora larici-populina 98AG31]EGG08092.1 hypothetical protein MELLADRAFT_105317 [Melampsora larici-populina 98AG31]